MRFCLRIIATVKIIALEIRFLPNDIIIVDTTRLGGINTIVVASQASP